MKKLAKKIIGFVLGNYSAYYIYRWDSNKCQVSSDTHDYLDVRLLDDETPRSIGDSRMQEQFGYGGSESLGFGCFFDKQLVGVCFYWYGQRYRKRNFWPLKEHEAKLVQIIVKPEMRGRGIATALIRHSSLEMTRREFTILYARIWHSNHPSRQAFERAGWGRIACVLEINPFRTERPIRLSINLRN